MTTYAGAQRKTALALWGAVGSLGVAGGVLLGGALTTWASWQAIFWVNVPVGLIALVVGRHIIAKDTAPRPGLRDFDLPGAATVIAGLGSLVYGLGATAAHGWWSAHRDQPSPARAICWRFPGWSRGRPVRCSRRTSGRSSRWSPAPP